MESQILLPDVEDEDLRGFWEGTRTGELRIQACDGCGKLRMPPRPMCPACNSIASRWQAVGGRGRVWSYVVPHPPLLPAYAEIAPYNVIVVELEEDPAIRLVGNLVAREGGSIGEIDPASIRIGEPVRVVFEQVDDVALPRWVRATD